jgi:hypothetical protein
MDQKKVSFAANHAPMPNFNEPFDPRARQEDVQSRSSLTSQGSAMMPQKRRTMYKMKTTLKSRTSKKATYLPTITEAAEEQLEKQIERNPFIKTVTTKEVFMIACSSNTFQNLAKRLASLEVKIRTYIKPEELRMIYVSANKVQAMEDTLAFFPSLYRLTKSVVVTEPIKDLSHLVGDEEKRAAEYAADRRKSGLFSELHPEEKANNLEDNYEEKMSQQNNQHYWARRTHVFSHSRANVVNSIRSRLLEEGIFTAKTKKDKLAAGKK